MIIYCNGEVHIINNNRVELKHIVNYDTKVHDKYDVYVDGVFFISSIVLFLEHRQYLLFEKNYSEIDFEKEFNNFESVVFYDMGTTTSTKDINNIKSGTVFKDYTEKGREGINYFFDIFIDWTKDDSFKNKYVRLGDLI